MGSGLTVRDCIADMCEEQDPSGSRVCCRPEDGPEIDNPCLRRLRILLRRIPFAEWTVLTRREKQRAAQKVGSPALNSWLVSTERDPRAELFYGTPFAVLQRRQLRTANYVPPATYRLAGLHSFRNVPPAQLKPIGVCSTPEPEEYKSNPAGQVRAISLGLEYHQRSEGHHEENWGQHAPQRC
jgi:hypothetical protein